MKARSEPRRRADRAPPAPLARCLVATDFSAGARRAVERAARLAAAGGGEVHVLHVAPPGTPEAAQKKARHALASTMSVIRELATQAGARRVRATSSVRTGDPYVEIIRYAREFAADVVVIGRGRPGVVRRRVIGSTAARVMRMSDVPTLLVGRGSRGPYRRPLIAIEIDPSARDLIELTHRIVGSNEVRLRICHVYRVPFESYYRASRDRSGAAYFRDARKAAVASMAALLESIGSPQHLVDTVLRRGDARSAIANEAARYRADLIALGTHGRSGVSHILLGSVAEWVIESTSRDVLVARPVRFTFVPP